MKVSKYKIIILSIFTIISIVFVYNDYFLYKSPILKVKEVKEIKSGSEYYEQIITGVIKNTKYKGKVMEVRNQASISGVYDDKIHKNSELLLYMSNNKISNDIKGIKRDKYIIILVCIFIDSIILIAGRKGVKTLLSLFLNILIFAFSIFIFSKKYNTVSMLALYLLVSVLFIITSMIITNGINKKSISTIVSANISLFVSFGLLFLIIKLFGKNISIWNMSFIEAVHDYKNFFYVTILLSGLGAIMDISITVSSSLNELIIKNKNISKKSLIKSSREITKDIVGTMSNVMLYTCFTPIICTAFVAMRNGVILANAVSIYGGLELIIVLCSCISIVLTIPISKFISIYILTYKSKGVNI